MAFKNRFNISFVKFIARNVHEINKTVKIKSALQRKAVFI